MPVVEEEFPACLTFQHLWDILVDREGMGQLLFHPTTTRDPEVGDEWEWRLTAISFHLLDIFDAFVPADEEFSFARVRLHLPPPRNPAPIIVLLPRFLHHLIGRTLPLDDEYHTHASSNRLDELFNLFDDPIVRINLNPSADALLTYRPPEDRRIRHIEDPLDCADADPSIVEHRQHPALHRPMQAVRVVDDRIPSPRFMTVVLPLLARLEVGEEFSFAELILPTQTFPNRMIGGQPLLFRPHTQVVLHRRLVLADHQPLVVPRVFETVIGMQPPRL